MCMYRMWVDITSSHSLDLFVSLLQESAEHYNRMLSERTQEIQALRRQLTDMQQKLATAEKQSSTAAQEGHFDTAGLRAVLAEKDSLINVSSSGIQHSDSAGKCARLRSLTRSRKETPTQIILLSYILPSNDLVAYVDKV